MAIQSAVTTPGSDGATSGLLFEFTVTSAQASIAIDTTAFPEKSLRMEVNGRATAAVAAMFIRFNGVSTATYNTQFFAVTADAVIAGTNQDGFQRNNIVGQTLRSDAGFQTGRYDIYQWYASNRNTQVLYQAWDRTGATDAGMRTESGSGQWSDNAVVTSIDLVTQSGNFEVGTNVRVYA